MDDNRYNVMPMWLLTNSMRDIFKQAQKNGLAPSVEQQLEYEARILSTDNRSSHILTISGNNAEIDINGIITDRPSLFALMFGGSNTMYSDINDALAIADQNSEVDNITLVIDSPGGAISGLFDTLAEIELIKKPIKAVVSNIAASAAYAIASQADKIVATNRAARFGSIGVVVNAYVSDDQIEIASTNAPKKAPDLSTEEGKAIVREELDALHDIFVDAIASGRNVSNDKINSNFGQGATLLADEALKRGMIDTVTDRSLSVVGGTDLNKTQPGVTNMDLDTLKVQHADVYSAILQEGILQERDRVGAHLTMGSASGDLVTAIKSINDGSTMTASLQATYMSAGMNRKDVSDKQDDDTAADVGNINNNDDDMDATVGNNILAAAATACGVELGEIKNG